MIYQCHKCNKLYDEIEGYMANSSIIGFGIIGSSMVFICKNCMSEKGKKIIEEKNKHELTKII